MDDITLMDVLYTGGMLFIAFYGAIFITKFFSKFADPQNEEEKKDDKGKEAK